MYVIAAGIGRLRIGERERRIIGADRSGTMEPLVVKRCRSGRGNDEVCIAALLRGDVMRLDCNRGRLWSTTEAEGQIVNRPGGLLHWSSIAGWTVVVRP